MTDLKGSEIVAGLMAQLAYERERAGQLERDLQGVSDDLRVARLALQEREQTLRQNDIAMAEYRQELRSMGRRGV